MEIADMIFWIFGDGWMTPTFRRLMDSQVLSQKVCQNQPKDPQGIHRDSNAPMREMFLQMYQTTRQVMPMWVLDSDLNCRFWARLISFAAPRGAAEIQKALGTTSLSNGIKMRRYGREHGTGDRLNM